MERLIEVDTDLSKFMIGCDPGPERCALALVIRNDVIGCLQVEGVAYPRWEDILDESPSAISAVIPMMGGMSLAYEKVTSRYGACPGATTYDTCRNSGVVLARFVRAGITAAYGLGTADWRVALGGRTNLSDAEVHAELKRILPDESEDLVNSEAKRLKKCYNLDKPIGCHLRDAVGVAVGAYLMKRHGTPASAREVWHV